MSIYKEVLHGKLLQGFQDAEIFTILASIAVSLAVFKMHCDLCSSEFNTTTALLQHRGKTSYSCTFGDIYAVLQWSGGCTAPFKSKKRGEGLQATNSR